MKHKLNIYSNNNFNNFLRAILNQYDLTFLKLEAIDYKEQRPQANIIFINNNHDTKLINFKNLKYNYLILSSLKNVKLNINNNIKLSKTPLSINNIKNLIENFIQNLAVNFKDISINNDKLINISNNAFCHLTKIEIEILSYLIKEKEPRKHFIKENILRIKPNIETNSLESHLTRIRKKMNKINTTVKIQTINEKLKIIV